jgi:aspartate/methionine/tyrosine aminotransferase
MNGSARAMGSTYLEWAKLYSAAPYKLATSGIESYPLAQLPVRIEDLAINGPTVYGYLPLQERLALLCGVTPECVVAATGTAMANHLAMAALLEPGDEVLVEEPTYGPMLEVASYLRASIRRIERRPASGFQVDVDELRGKVTAKTRLIVLTNLHNPSGALLTEETLRAIGAAAAQVGAHVLVDEVYLPMVYDPPVRSSFHLGPQFVVTNSLTKAYGLSGLRCGWILAEPKLAHRMWRLNDLFAASPVHPGELLSVIALDHLQQIDARAREILAANRRALDAFFAACAAVEGFRSAWGTVTFPRLRQGSVDEFCEHLRARYQTSVVPGRFFEMPDHFRIGIGGDPEMTAEGLKRLGEALKEFQAGH